MSTKPSPHPASAASTLDVTAAAREHLIVALDVPGAPEALALADRLECACRWVKVGLELYVAAGPAVLEPLLRRGYSIFLDLKFHDIPNTVAGAVLASAAMPGVQLVNVHALGGTAMLRAATQAVSASVPMGADRARLLAVTILTSMDHKAMRDVGIGGAPRLRAVKLAKLAQDAGVDGVVASVQEAKAIRKACGPEFLIVTPGVRPKELGAHDDQTRTATPREAIKAGADFIVVGRPILAADNPRAAAQEIVDEIAAAK